MAALTHHAVRTMHGMDSSMDDEFFVPTVQVLRLKKLPGEEGEKWTVVLSDGTHFLYGECAPDLHPLIHNHIIAQNAIIRVRQFAMSDRGGRRLCTIFEAERVAPNPGTYFGSPIDIQLASQSHVPFRRVDESTYQGRELDAVASLPSPSMDAFFSSRSVPRWHNAQRDLPHRRNMIENLERILVDAEKVQEPSIPTERRVELSILAKQWELQLYRQAPSFDEYNDKATFEKRVSELVQRANGHGEHYRLHLLRHAMSCNVDACTVTPFCRDVKDVILHMEECREDDNCQVPFCDTLRQLTMHSARCQTKDCQVCDPDARMPDSCPLCKAEETANERLGSSSPATLAALKQEYLLTLFHSSLCPHEEDSHCLTSPLCFDLKRLWIHKIYCVDRECRYALCKTSREALDHFKSCTVATCAVCPVVRATREKFGIERIAPDAPSEAKMNRKPRAESGSASSSSEEVVASQAAIYEAIQRKNKLAKGTSDTSTSDPNNRPETIVASSHADTTDDAVMSDVSGSSSLESQILEYERLNKAHRRRTSWCSSSSNLPSSTGRPEEADGDAKPAHLPRDKDGKPSAGEGKADYPSDIMKGYLATTQATKENIQPVTCFHCRACLFAPVHATQFYCEECLKMSIDERKSTFA